MSPSRFVRAKTGTLRGVSCLSGYAGGVARTPLVFSILMNDLPPDSRPRACAIQDEMAAALVRYVGIQ